MTPQPYTMADMHQLEEDISRRPHRYSVEEHRLIRTVKEVANSFALVVRSLDRESDVNLDPKLREAMRGDRQRAISKIREILGV